MSVNLETLKSIYFTNSSHSRAQRDQIDVLLSGTLAFCYNKHKTQNTNC